MWTIIRDREYTPAKLRYFVKGRYQRNLLEGRENLSGSTLKGKAARYGLSYKRSRAALLGRLRAAGVPLGEMRGMHGARILVIG